MSINFLLQLPQKFASVSCEFTRDERVIKTTLSTTPMHHPHVVKKMSLAFIRYDKVVNDRLIFIVTRPEVGSGQQEGSSSSLSGDIPDLTKFPLLLITMEVAHEAGMSKCCLLKLSVNHIMDFANGTIVVTGSRARACVRNTRRRNCV